MIVVITVKGWVNHSKRITDTTLYNSTQQVPLIIKDPRLKLAGHHKRPCRVTCRRLSDVCDILDQRTPEGISDAVSQRLFTDKKWSLFFATPRPMIRFFRKAVLNGACLGPLVVHPDNTTELYDLEMDPGETRNLAETNETKLQEMEEALATMEAKHDSCSHPRMFSSRSRRRGHCKASDILGGAISTQQYRLEPTLS